MFESDKKLANEGSTVQGRAVKKVTAKELLNHGRWPNNIHDSAIAVISIKRRRRGALHPV